MQVPNLQECVHRNRGFGGKVTVSARSARRSSEPSPNASLVPFCASRKELAHQGETMTQERR